jgi:hypothetical protein
MEMPKADGMWPDNTLDQTAAHESGHAIARLLLRIPFTRVEVIAVGDARVVSGEDAKAEWLPSLPDNYTVSDAIAVGFDSSRCGELFDFCVATAAGPVAQMCYESQPVSSTLDGFEKFGGSSDAAFIHAYALVLAGTEHSTVEDVIDRKDELVAEILETAHRLVESHRYWISSLAAALERRQTLSRFEVEEMKTRCLPTADFR